MWYKTTLRNSRPLLGKSLFNASALTHVNANPLFTPHTPTVLRIQGVQVDVVLDLKSVYLGSCAVQPHDAKQLPGRLFREIHALCQQSRKLKTGAYSSEQLHEALWRVPIRDHEVEPADGSDSQEYRRATQLSRTRYFRHLPLFKAIEAELAVDALRRSPTPGWWHRGQIFWQKSRYHFYKSYFTLHQSNLGLLGSFVFRAKVLFSRWFGIQRWQHLDWLEQLQISRSETTYYLGTMLGPLMRPFITQRGYIGLGPSSMEKGDIVSVFHGARVPHLLRPWDGERRGHSGWGRVRVWDHGWRGDVGWPRARGLFAPLKRLSIVLVF